MPRKAATNATPEKEAADHAKLLFCAALSDGLTIRQASAEAGVDRATVYRWRKQDAEFAQAWDDALESGTDVLEAEAIHRAVHGVDEPVIYQGQLTPIYERNPDGSVRLQEVDQPDGQGGTRKAWMPVHAVDAEGNPKYLTVRKPSDTLLIFMLKARRPEVYRERHVLEHTGKGGKELPAPAAPAGVLVVPGLMADTAAWASAAQKASIKGA